MAKALEQLKIEAKKDLARAQTLEVLDGIFRTYLGRKGDLTLVLRSLAKLPKAKRKTIGSKANALRDFLMQEIEQKKTGFLKKEALRLASLAQGKWLDVSAPGKKIETGHLHPITLVQRKAQEIFQSMGFEIADGPEIEDEWHNFDALNIPKNHPARDMWDTFWLKEPKGGQRSKVKGQKLLLRTHTSPVQIRYMETHTPPLRIIAPGRIFRYEATDARHEINFYQLEGLMVGKKVSAANFKAVIEEFYRRFFGKDAKVRFRPSYFPFTEPSFEVDMAYNAGWMEMMGAGMVHPNVFKAVHYNPQDWQGFAFGMGLDRLAMIQYKVNDIRLFYGGDLRFLQQF